jgi:hypothetical protein
MIFRPEFLADPKLDHNSFSYIFRSISATVDVGNTRSGRNPAQPYPPLLIDLSAWQQDRLKEVDSWSGQWDISIVDRLCPFVPRSKARIIICPRFTSPEFFSVPAADGIVFDDPGYHYVTHDCRVS